MQPPRLPDPLAAEFIRTTWFESGDRRPLEIFHEFVEIFAITLRQSALRLRGLFDRGLESRYLMLVSRLPVDLVRGRLPELLGRLQLELHDRPRDILGPVFMALGTNARAGQFFTPDALSGAMATAVLPSKDEILHHIVARRRPIRISDPAVGGGSMPLAVHRELLSRGVPTAWIVDDVVDVDLHCFHLAYVQMALAGCAARVRHGDSLTLLDHAAWSTPVLETLAAQSQAKLAPPHAAE